MHGSKRAARGTTSALFRSISMVATRYRHWLRIFNCLRALPCFAKGWLAARKGLSGGIAIAVLVVQSCFAFASNKIPLPTPRPMEASASTPQAPDKTTPETSNLSACQISLTQHIAIAPIAPPIQETGGCGGDDLVRLETIILQNGARVSLRPAALVRCPLAKALADWIRDDMAALVANVGVLREIDIAGSYECRDRNRVSGERLSEHARANAIDVVGVSLRSAGSISFTDRLAARELREKARNSACRRFPTVLGPGSDGYHEDHIHLDLLVRKSGYRICQWNVLGP